MIAQRRVFLENLTNNIGNMFEAELPPQQRDAIVKLGEYLFDSCKLRK